MSIYCKGKVVVTWGGNGCGLVFESDLPCVGPVFSEYTIECIVAVSGDCCLIGCYNGVVNDKGCFVEFVFGSVY